jgi:hypothetical protein
MTSEWADIKLLFRQVHPNHWDGKNPNSVAFSPTPKDDDQLSVDDGNRVTPEIAWDHFTNKLGFKSAGTWAVSPEEVLETPKIDLSRDPVVNAEDPAKNNPAHCVIDFSKLSSKGERKKAAQTLALKASARGCQYLAPP